MKVRHMVAASMIGTVGVLATSGIASAQTAPASCANATARVSNMEARVTKLEQRLATLETRIAIPQSGKHHGSAASLRKRIDRFSRKRDQLGEVISKINTRCTT
jgi:hypothetical protein